ncbi:DUF1259 domain-containing protein [Bacillus aquiflavi]|uniref:DUF1259 domain-containing protein n=1 Tax=Bacillus aquiflavi TaxID=2672567 RepID=UPI001CA9C2A8|nr:DUF1259 domain-containing protein [Bacillus aquiflavi]UAC49967.1 DUF1259 domain-containing protein [Bacillus aquiflavi]
MLGGSGSFEDGVCFVQKLRQIPFRIEGVPTNSPLVLPQLFSFEIRHGKVLNLGETVLLQEEVNPLISELRKRKIKVTAFHNHWLFEEPRAMYLHFQSTSQSPLTFAKNVAEAFKVLDRSHHDFEYE